MLEYLPTGKYKAQLKETLNQLPQMQQQLEQASQQIDQLSAELTRQTQQNVELSKRINIEKTTQKVDKEATKTIFELRDLVRQVKREVEALKTKDSSDNKE
jgi:predicted translin family RNA/ssDNA-binding protein